MPELWSKMELLLSWMNQLMWYLSQVLQFLQYHQILKSQFHFYLHLPKGEHHIQSRRCLDQLYWMMNPWICYYLPMIR